MSFTVFLKPEIPTNSPDSAKYFMNVDEEKKQIFTF